jgi:hypothetical protein
MKKLDKMKSVLDMYKDIYRKTTIALNSGTMKDRINLDKCIQSYFKKGFTVDQIDKAVSSAKENFGI